MTRPVVRCAKLESACRSDRPTPAFGGEQFVSHGIVDDRCRQGAIVFRPLPCRPLLQAHRNAELRKPVGEVGGSVQRVNVPAKLAFEPLARALFAIDSVFRESLAQARTNQFFNRPVRNGYQVYVALIFGFDACDEVLAQARSRLARNLGGLRNVCKSS